jgi:tRNA synthetase class II core domain (G, H, P, S and T)
VRIVDWRSPTDTFFGRRQVYSIAGSPLCLTGTAEVPLAGLHMDAILPGEALPLRLAAFGRAFRTEAGAAGSASRGLYRLHQFSKVGGFVGVMVSVIVCALRPKSLLSPFRRHGKCASKSALPLSVAFVVCHLMWGHFCDVQPTCISRSGHNALPC